MESSNGNHSGNHSRDAKRQKTFPGLGFSELPHDIRGMIAQRTSVDDIINLVRSGAIPGTANIDARQYHDNLIRQRDMWEHLVGGDNYYYTVLENALKIDNFTKLDLAWVKDPDGFGPLETALSDPQTTVITLFITKAHLNEEAAVAIANALAKNKTLTTLDISENEICKAVSDGPYTANGVKALAEALEENKVLRYLNLSQNQLCGIAAIGPIMSDDEYSDEGISALANAMKTNQSLMRLDISKNTITSKGAVALAPALLVNVALKELNLQGNLVGAEGAKAIGEALEKNRVLTALNLANNQIRDQGAAAIAEALRGNRVLTSLDVRGNNISSTGAAAIRDAVSGREGFELKM